MAAVDTSVQAAIGRAHEAVRISCISNIIGSSVDVYIAITRNMSMGKRGISYGDDVGSIRVSIYNSS